MKWDEGHKSEYVEDRRGLSGPSRAGLGGGGLQLPLMLFQRFGFPGLLVGAALLYFGGGLSGGGESANAGSAMAPGEVGPEEQSMVSFVSFVLDDVQQTWSQTLGGRYRPARLVLFRGQTASGCGMGQAAMGPFYCPRDQKAYIDLSFYAELRQRFGAPGDFAQAYVLAHEIGHHVQNLLGTSDKVHAAPRSQQNGPKGLSTRLELQADCYAGLWAHSAQARDLLEIGDVEEALRAATAIGDDTLQRQGGGRVAPESWTHGSSAQRVRWFKTGLQAGNIDACDTFSIAEP